MTVTDREQLLREAVVTILEADATLQTLGGGTSRVFDRLSISPDEQMPAIGYELVTFNYGDDRAQIRLTAIAKDAASAATTRALLEAAEATMTYPAFAAAGVEAVPSTPVRETLVEAGDLQELTGSIPNFRQADSRMDLLVFE